MTNKYNCISHLIDIGQRHLCNRNFQVTHQAQSFLFALLSDEVYHSLGTTLDALLYFSLSCPLTVLQGLFEAFQLTFLPLELVNFSFEIVHSFIMFFLWFFHVKSKFSKLFFSLFLFLLKSLNIKVSSLKFFFEFLK